jgi:hypothetical protein
MGLSKKKIRYFIFAILIITLYYQLDYKRNVICSIDKSECLTICQRVGNNCYIIPGKYYGFIAPRSNYIKTKNYRNYIGVLWDTEDNFDYKVAIYNDYDKKELKENIRVYHDNDSLLLEYKILDVLDYQRGKRIVNDSADFYENKYDYVYIDLNRIYGIKIYNR